MTLGGRGLTEDEAALLGAVSQAGLMDFDQLLRAMGEAAETRRRLYRLVRRLRALPSDSGQTVSRVRRAERMRADFKCPVCGQGAVEGVARRFLPQQGSAESDYRHIRPKGGSGEAQVCHGPRMTIAEGKALRQAEVAYSIFAPEPELLDTIAWRERGAATLVYGLSDDGAAALRAWCERARIAMAVRAGPDVESWRYVERALSLSEVYVRALVASGNARQPWAFPAVWEVEPGVLKWKTKSRTADGQIVTGHERYVRPDITMFVPPGQASGLARGRRVFLAVEQATQRRVDLDHESVGTVELKVKAFEALCCYAPLVEGPVLTYYRRTFSADRAEPWLVVVATEKRKKAILRGLGARESLGVDGLHGFRVRIVALDEVGAFLSELAGRPAVPGAVDAPVKAPPRRSAVAPPGVTMTMAEADVLGKGVLELRRLYERLREHVRTANASLPQGVPSIPVEATPAAWSSGARPLIERLLREVVEAAAQRGAAPPMKKA